MERFIRQHPEALGLGDLEVVGTQVHSEHGGTLDVLAYQSATNTYFEVELMRGSADHWHITHALDYWSQQRKAKPYSQHVAVLVAESCRGRFGTLLRTLADSLPLIVMELHLHATGDDHEYRVQCVPIYFPDDALLSDGRRLTVRRTSDDVLASVTGACVMALALREERAISGTVRDVAERAGIGKTMAATILRALDDRGFVEGAGVARGIVDRSRLLEFFKHVILASPGLRASVLERTGIDGHQLG